MSLGKVYSRYRFGCLISPSDTEPHFENPRPQSYWCPHDRSELHRETQTTQDPILTGPIALKHMASTPRNTRGAHKTQAVGVIRSFFRDSPLPDSNEFIEEFVMRHSYTYEYPDTPHGQRLWQQYHGDKINKEARQAILAKFGGKEEEVVEEDAEVTKEFVTQGEYADTDSDTSDGHFSLPLPVDEGVLADRDFRLPWNIYCPTGSVKPKSWKSIKRSEYERVEENRCGNCDTCVVIATVIERDLALID